MSTPTGPAGSGQPDQPDYGSVPQGGAQPAGYGAQSYPGGAPAGQPQKPSNGMGTAALVLGIIGLVLAITVVVYWLGGILCILAIIFGILGRNKAKRGEATNRGVATGGLVTGIIGLVIAIIITVLGIIGLSILGGPSGQQFQQCIAQAGQDQAAQQACGQQFGQSITGQ